MFLTRFSTSIVNMLLLSPYVVSYHTKYAISTFICNKSPKNCLPVSRQAVLRLKHDLLFSGNTALPLIIKQICDLLRQRGQDGILEQCIKSRQQQGAYHHGNQDLKGRIYKTLPLFSGKDAGDPLFHASALYIHSYGQSVHGVIDFFHSVHSSDFYYNECFTGNNR